MFEFLVVATLSVIFFYFGLRKRDAKTPDGAPETKPSDDTVHHSYEKACLFVNRSELAFFHALRTKLPSQYYVLTKVRMEDIVRVDKTIVDRKRRYGLRGRVKSRHVDFCVIDDNGMPHVIIELDGKSHNSKQAKNADDLKNGIFKACEIPFVRVRKGEDFHAWAHRIVAELPRQAYTPPQIQSKNVYSLPA